MNFAKALKRLQIEKDLKNYDISEALGLTEKTISNWRSGNAKPTTRKEIILCETFGVKYSTFCKWGEDD